LSDKPFFGIVFERHFCHIRSEPALRIKGEVVFKAVFYISIDLFGYSEGEAFRGKRFPVIIFGAIIGFILPPEFDDPTVGPVFTLIIPAFHNRKKTHL
jgi:hypothetical protein